ncbi:hypothetical protein [Taibaiella sp. KBW10]|uniref:hypothetical protein n=1 Tax=Taibaiella sp. KBW10 TaxID=2153357 RepID=UPI000F5A763D|nr:hypothetical protein [Taibaiella sp. KBW10]
MKNLILISAIISLNLILGCNNNKQQPNLQQNNDSFAKKIDLVNIDLVRICKNEGRNNVVYICSDKSKLDELFDTNKNLALDAKLIGFYNVQIISKPILENLQRYMNQDCEELKSIADSLKDYPLYTVRFYSKNRQIGGCQYINPQKVNNYFGGVIKYMEDSHNKKEYVEIISKMKELLKA